MGKKSSPSPTPPVYPMPTQGVSRYKGVSDEDRQARIDILKDQFLREKNLEKAIKVSEAKKAQLEDAKEELDSRKGVEDVLSNAQRGFKKKPKPKTEEELFYFLGDYQDDIK